MAELKDNNDGLSVVDRIMIAGDTLGVSPRQIMEEIIRLANENDIAGMQSLFKAYEKWESREKKTGVSAEQIEQLARDNFDVVARVADGYIASSDDFSAMTYGLESENKPPGKILLFIGKQ